MSTKLQTEVAIVGAGPAGLLLAHLLRGAGIESVVLEVKSLDYITSRVRAGVLEQTTVDLLRSAGLSARLDKESLRHEGVELRFCRQGHRIDFASLTGGRGIYVYPQHKLVADLASGVDQILYEVSDVSLSGIDGPDPAVFFTDNFSVRRKLSCKVIAGCDGFHGISRAAIPESARRLIEHEYPFAWLGILAETPPASEELIYTHHSRGFALHSMRSPSISRLYLQVPPDADLSSWPEDRIWSELHTRLSTTEGLTLAPGPIIDRGITAMRSFVVDPMQYGNLYLAGDAAHIVPPTGAKGLNLAVADVAVLARALREYLRFGRSGALLTYSRTCLRRVWRVQHFSWWMTSMLHRFPEHDEFQQQLQLSQLRYIISSRAAATTLAENYTGLPLDIDFPA